MLCPNCGKEAGNEVTCGSCGAPTSAPPPMSPTDEVIWSSDEPTVPTAAPAGLPPITPSTFAEPSMPGDPTNPEGIRLPDSSGSHPKPKDPTSPSAARPRPGKDVLMKRRLIVGGGALVALILLIVIIVVAAGGGDGSKSPTTDSTPTSDASGPTATDLTSGPLTTDSVPSSLAPIGATGIDESVSLIKGSTGPQVQAVQEALLARNYEVTVNGVFDDATVAAVKAFQKDINLPVVGKAGPATRAALGLGIDKETGFDTYKAAVDAVVTYLNKGTYSLLPKDTLKALYAFRTITKGKRIVWSVETLEVTKLVAEPAAGQAVAALKLYNQTTKNSHTLTVCFTKDKPITWCGLWKYE